MPVDSLLEKSYGGATDRRLIKLWILRALVYLGVHRKFVEADNFADPALAKELGLTLIVQRKSGAVDRQATQDMMFERLNVLESERKRYRSYVRISDPLATNIAALSTLLNLTKTERQILAFAVLLRFSPGLIRITEMLGAISMAATTLGASYLLNERETHVRAALASDSILQRSGIVPMESKNERLTLRIRFRFSKRDFASRLIERVIEPVELLGQCIEPPMGFIH